MPPPPAAVGAGAHLPPGGAPAAAAEPLPLATAGRPLAALVGSAGARWPPWAAVRPLAICCPVSDCDGGCCRLTPPCSGFFPPLTALGCCPGGAVLTAAGSLGAWVVICAAGPAGDADRCDGCCAGGWGAACAALLNMLLLGGLPSVDAAEDGTPAAAAAAAGCCDSREQTPPPASAPLQAAPPPLLPLLLGLAPLLLAARRARWRAMRCAGPTACASAGDASVSPHVAAAAAGGCPSRARFAGCPLKVL